MTNAHTIIDTRATTTASQAAARDANAKRELHIEAVHRLLVSTWPDTVHQPDSNVLHAVARALVASGTPIPAVPSTQAAGRLLAEALSDARSAHTRALADHAAADSA